MLDLVSIAIMVVIIVRMQFFITLTQRSNIETLTLAIIFVLAAYYVATTYKGFIGALKMAWLNLPGLWTKDAEKLEQRKQDALKDGGSKKYVCFDKAVRLKGKPDQPITWEVGDDTGKLGELVLDGVKATFRPEKQTVSDSLFEFLADQIEQAIGGPSEPVQVQIVQWSSIDEDKASEYNSMVQAFQNLQEQLKSSSPVWPTLELEKSDVDWIGERLRELVPTLRNEAMLPNLEYAVQYSVPVLPEPLGFVKLTRKENRADPVTTMGCAGVVMLFVVLLLVFFILLPPWVPSR